MTNIINNSATNKSKGVEASVIIITKNQKNYLKKSLPVLLKQKFDAEYEIIVVDSGSTDGAIEYIQSLPVKLVKINTKTFNFAKAFNIGAKKSRGKYLIRLSGDAIPIGTSLISELIKHFSDPKVGGTFGKYKISGREGWNYPDYWPSERFPKKTTRYTEKVYPFSGINLGGVRYNNPNRSHIYDFAGGCCAIKKSVWKKRPFNESLIGAEDAEYSWFLHLIGYDIVYTPHAKTLHEHEAPAGLRPGYLLPVLRREQNPSEAEYASHSFPIKSGCSAKGDKITKSTNKSLTIKTLLGKWQHQMTWTIAKYWLGKLIGYDPYKDLKIN